MTSFFLACFYITEEIVQRFASDQPLELQEAIWKKCLYSISTKCKVLRSQKQDPDEIDGGLHVAGSYMQSSGGDLDLLANVTCPEDQDDIHRMVVGQTVAHENHLTQQVACAEQQEEVHQTVVEQEGQMVTHENHLTQQVACGEQQEEVHQTVVEQDGQMVTHENQLAEQVVQFQQQEVPMDVTQGLSNGLCEQHVQVGELVQQDGGYV